MTADEMKRCLAGLVEAFFERGIQNYIEESKDMDFTGLKPNRELFDTSAHPIPIFQGASRALGTWLELQVFGNPVKPDDIIHHTFH